MVKGAIETKLRNNFAALRPYYVDLVLRRLTIEYYINTSSISDPHPLISAMCPKLASFASHCDRPAQYRSARGKGMHAARLYNPRVCHNSHKDIGTYVAPFGRRNAQPASTDDKRIPRSPRTHFGLRSSCNWSRLVLVPNPAVLEVSSIVFHR